MKDPVAGFFTQIYQIFTKISAGSRTSVQLKYLFYIFEIFCSFRVYEFHNYDIHMGLFIFVVLWKM